MEMHNQFFLDIEMNIKQFCDFCKEPYSFNGVELEKYVEMTIKQPDGSVVCPICYDVRTAEDIKRRQISEVEILQSDIYKGIL